MTAYVLLFLDVTKSPPVVTGARILSEETPTLDTNHVAIAVLKQPGANFGEAQHRVRSFIAESRFHAWLRPLLEMPDPMSAPLDTLTAAQLQERCESEETRAVELMQQSEQTRVELARRADMATPSGLEINIDGELHVSGTDKCCDVRPCPRCNAPQHYQPVYGGIAYCCERCDADRWRSRGTYVTDSMIDGVGEPGSFTSGTVRTSP